MKPVDFRAYIALCRDRGMSEGEVAAMIGCGKNSLTRWKRYPAPPYVGLAIAALERGLQPWTRN
jgi:hypothetical protein